MTFQSRLAPFMTARTTFFAKISVSVAVAGVIALLAVTQANAAPSATLTASKTDLRQGEAVTLTWSSSDATTCTGTGFSTGGATSGSVTVTPVDDASYSVACTKQVQLWARTSGPTTTNAKVSCVEGTTQSGACPAQEGTSCATTGSTCTTTLRDPDSGICRTTRTTYTCQSQTQSATASASVTVRDVSVTLTSSPGTVTSGGSATLSWNVTGATTCTSNGFNWGNQMSGSATVTPTDSTSYSLSCTNGTPITAGTWVYKESDISDLDCGPGCIEAPNNSPGLPYGSIVCSPPNPSGQACSQTSICANSSWRHDPLRNVGVNYYDTDLYECTATGSTGSSDVDSATVIVTQIPDLVGQVGGAATASANQPVTLYGGVANQGGGAAGYFPNLIQVCDTNCATVNQTIAATAANSLAAGGWQQVSASYTPTSQVQQFYRVCANNNTSWVNVHAESNYANNCSGWQNLTVASNILSVSCVASPDDTITNESVSWEAFVNNPGGTSSGQSWQSTGGGGNTKVCSGGSNTTAFQNTCAEDVTNGASCSANQVGTVCKVAMDQDACAADGGTVYGNVQKYRCTANSTNAPTYTYSWSGTDGLSGTSKQVTKSYSTVGTKQGTVSVQGSDGRTGTATCEAVISAPADLTAGSITPTSATAGVPISLSATATNIGSGTSGSFPLLFQVSETGVLTNSSYIAALTAGASNSGSANHTFPSAGTYQVRACANYNTSWVAITSESNYGNNCGPWTSITVASAGTPSVSCTVSSTNIQPGQSVTYTANPSNGAGAPYTWTSSDNGSFGSGTVVNRTLTTPGVYAMNVDTPTTAVGYCPDVTVAASWCTNASTVLTITATPNRVRAGQSVALTWSADGVNGQNATCSVSGPGVSWSAAVAAAPVCTASGSANPTITTQSTYTLTCAGQSKSVTVNVIPNFQEF